MKDDLMPNTVSDTAYIQSISQALVKARQNLTPLAEFPGELPSDLPTAYAVQAASIKAWPTEVAGWKVGGVMPNLQDKFKAKRMAGPIFPEFVKTCAEGETITMGAFPGGFVAMEAEYIVVLKDVSGLDRDITLEDMAEYVEAVYTGVEIASSPMMDVNALGPTSIVSDFGNNAGMIYGPKVENPFSVDFTKHVVSVTIDGETVGAKPTGLGEAGPFGAVKFLVNHLRAHNVAIPAGTAVSTGAVSGVHQTKIGTHSQIKFEGLGTFNVDLIPFTLP